MEDFEIDEQECEYRETVVKLRLISHNARLVDTRKALGLTQAQLAQMVDIDTNRISAFETIRALPNEQEAEELSTLLGVSVDYLFPDVIVDAVKLDTFNRKKCTIELGSPLVEQLNFRNASRLLSSEAIETAEQNVNQEQLKEKLEEILGEFKKQERNVIILRFGLRGREPMTLAQVGELFGVTPERIRQIEGKALRRLRHPICARKLRPYLA